MSAEDNTSADRASGPPRAALARRMGTAPAIRKPKPGHRIGQNTARLYCEVCGQKRSVCRCEVAS